MPRPKSQSRETLLDKALIHFWDYGFGATSIDELVCVLGTSRHGLYSAFGGKHKLFLDCLEHYQEKIVTPAFAQVEVEGATLQTVAAYFEFQIARAESGGLPGPGCMIANVATEIGGRNDEILARVRSHHDRLHSGFANALTNSVAGRHMTLDVCNDLANLMVVTGQGLWSFSRSVSNAVVLRRSARALLDLVTRRISS